MAKKAETFQDKWGAWNLAADRSRLFKPVETIPTGSLTIDLLLGNGWPVGGTHVIWGPEGSYKTAFCQMMAGERLRRGHYVLWFDMETHFEPEIAAKNGMDLTSDRFALFVDPGPGQPNRVPYETVAKIVEDFLEDDSIDKYGAMIVIDSLNNLLTKKEQEGEVDDAAFGPKAKMNARWLPQMQAATRHHSFDLVFIGQVRDKMGVSSPYEPKIYLSGGRVLKHSPRVKLRFEASDWANNVKTDDRTVGKLVTVTVENNRTSLSYLRAHLACRQDLPGAMVDTVAEIIELAPKRGIMEKRGAWYYYIAADGAEHKWQGENGVRAGLTENPDLLDEIKQRILG